jgi:TPP-dependent pyruvate/acetoin dehydrogenase alpha subunit
MTGDVDPVERDTGIELLRLLVTTRVVEERLERLHRQGRVAGGLYRSLGQEAGAVGATFALERRADGTGDVVAPPYRGCGVHLTMGATVAEILRQLTGAASSPSGGRETGAGWSDFRRGLVGTVAPLGTMVEVMAGCALAFQLRGDGRVAMVFTGDGAASTGAWHEGVALAAARRAPLVIVVENNQWAFSTRSTSDESAFPRKGPGYGLETSTVDGTDVFAVQEASADAVARARSGGGVQLLELRYFRRSPHAPHDALEYVDPEELAQWEARDPIERLREALSQRGLEPSQLDAIRTQIEGAVEESAARVLSEEAPDGQSAMEGVVSGGPVASPWTRQGATDSRRRAAHA